MARQINRLVARTLGALPIGRHADGNGLYLYVKTGGSRSWVLMYKAGGKRRETGLGALANVSLADARTKARDIHQLLHEGTDPLAKAERDALGTVSFGDVAADLVETLKAGWKNAKHGQQWINTLKTHAQPLWDQPVDAVVTEDVLSVLAPIWTTIPETATRVRGRVERVLDAAKVRGLRHGDNPARWRGHLEILLTKRKQGSRGHHSAMPFADLQGFIKELQARPAMAARALEFVILTAGRTSEVLLSEWSEFDLKQKLWTVPAQRMKARVEHRVPLTPRAVAILEHVKFLGRPRPFPMSNMAMLNLMKRMELERYTVHGFRSAFRDWVGEVTDFPRELAEAALSHQVGNEVERAYRRGDALNKRREMMLAWEAYLMPPSAVRETAQDQPDE